MMKRFRILLADDDIVMLAAIGRLLSPHFEIAGMVEDGHSLVEAALRLNPDVIVSDISMPKLNGIEAARRVHYILPRIKFIFLTMHENRSYRKAALSVGASGYVLKSCARKELLEIVFGAVEGTR
jgi:DNA-binding NarL/FixJ family response regulator